MRDYEQLRRHWIEELERSGELSGLGSGERVLLERGSLDVLAATRLGALGRRRRASRALVIAAYATFFGSLAAAAHGLPVASAALLFAVLAMLFLGHRFARTSQERLVLYEHLSRTRRWLDYALR
jgi:hypothetical protein